MADQTRATHQSLLYTRCQLFRTQLCTASTVNEPCGSLMLMTAVNTQGSTCHAAINEPTLFKCSAPVNGPQAYECQSYHTGHHNHEYHSWEISNAQICTYVLIIGYTLNLWFLQYLAVWMLSGRLTRELYICR